MELRFITAKQRAFTLLELFVVIALVALIAGLIPASITRSKPKAQRIKCSSNLKQIALSFKMYAGDHNERFPWESPDGQSASTAKQMVWQYFNTLSNELGSAKLLMCPGDITRLENRASDFTVGPEGLSNPTNKNSAVSYFLGVFASSNQSNALLTGDRNLAPDEKAPLYHSRAAQPVDIPASAVWSPLPNQKHHDNAGNYALADGSVQQASNARLQEALRLARDSYGTNANRFLFPQ